MRNYFFYPIMQCPPPSPEHGASPPSPVPESQQRTCLSPVPMSSTSSSKKRCAPRQEEDTFKDMSICEEKELFDTFGVSLKPIGKEDSEPTKKRRLTVPSSNPAKRTPRRLSLEKYLESHSRNPVQAVETISRFARMQFSPESANQICSTITQKLWQSSLTSSPGFAGIRSNRKPCQQCNNMFRAQGGNKICFICYLENQTQERSIGDGSEQEMSESPTLPYITNQLRRSLSQMENIQTSITPTEANELSFWIGHVNVSTNSLMDCLNRLRMGTSSPLSMKPTHSGSNPPMSSSSPISRPKNPLCQEIDGMS